MFIHIHKDDTLLASVGEDDGVLYALSTCCLADLDWRAVGTTWTTWCTHCREDHKKPNKFRPPVFTITPGNNPVTRHRHLVDWIKDWTGLPTDQFEVTVDW